MAVALSENVCDRALAKDPQFHFCRRRRASRTVPVGFRSAWMLSRSRLPEPFARSSPPAQGVALPRETPWPQHSELPLGKAAATLPAPARSLFEMPDGLRVALHSAPSPRHAEQAGSSEHEAHAKVVSADTGGSRHLTREKPRLGRHRPTACPGVAGRRTAPAAMAHRGRNIWCRSKRETCAA